MCSKHHARGNTFMQRLENPHNFVSHTILFPNRIYLPKLWWWACSRNSLGLPEENCKEKFDNFTKIFVFLQQCTAGFFPNLNIWSLSTLFPTFFFIPCCCNVTRKTSWKVRNKNIGLFLFSSTQKKYLQAAYLKYVKQYFGFSQSLSLIW